MKISRQCLGFRNRQVECEITVVPRRRGATSRIQYVAHCHGVTGVRRSEQLNNLFFKRQNVRTLRPLNNGPPRCPEMPCANNPMTRGTVKSFKVKTDYIYLKLNSKDPAE